jgi:cyclophilin family peptidyl-prolyl cis-trans isomerase/HEAT repeat protein
LTRRGRRRRCARAAIAAVAIAGACVGGSRDDHSATDTLSSDEIALYARVLAAADRRDPDTATFARAVRDKNPALRAAGLRAIGQVHVIAQLSLLEHTLGDQDTSAAATAAYALGLLRDSTTVAPLAAAIATPVTESVEAAWALGEIGEPARHAITTALAQPDREPAPVTEALLLAAAKLHPVPIEAVRPFLSPSDNISIAEPERRIVRAAAYAVGRQRVPGGARALARLASSPDRETRLSVARGLTQGAAGDSLAPIAQQALGALTTDPDPNVRATAVQSLGSFGEAGRARVIAALHDSATNVRVAAAGVLDRVLQREGPPWDSAYERDTSFVVRRVIVAAAARAGIVLDALDPTNSGRWQRNADWRHRAAAADAAASLTLSRLLRVAGPLLADADPRVRLAALNAVAPWIDSIAAPQTQAVRSAVSAGLEDRDTQVRSTALGALVDRARAPDVDVGLRAYHRAEADSAVDARVAALRLISAAWLHDSVRVSDSARAALAQITPSSDLREISALGAGSVWTAWKGQWRESPLHPTSWYDSVVRTIVVPTLAGHPLVAAIRTARGPLTVTLFGDIAPLTVANFVELARASYYRGTTFHRVVPAFVVQDGDRRGDGGGGPAYAIRDEFNRARYGRGTLGMALSGPNTGGSQYFLTLTPQPHLDGHYTVFGALRDGFAALDRIVQGDSIADVVIE